MCPVCVKTSNAVHATCHSSVLMPDLMQEVTFDFLTALLNDLRAACKLSKHEQKMQCVTRTHPPPRCTERAVQCSVLVVASQ